MLKVYRRRTPSDGNSSHGPDEQKKLITNSEDHANGHQQRYSAYQNNQIKVIHAEYDAYNHQDVF